MVRSRLKKKQERQLLKNFFLSALGIIIIVAVLIKYGIPLLVNFSLFISGSNIDQESKTNDNSPFIVAPTLRAQNLATNSAKFKIEGSTLPNHEVMLYINGNLEDKVSSDDKGDFSSLITLSTDSNTIKAKTLSSDGRKSDFSESLIIVYKNTPPTLEITSPSDNQSFSKDQSTAEIKGKTDPQVRVTVNNFWAIVDEENNFYYNLTLKEGLNEIKIVAQDPAGNKTEKILNVTYYP